MTKFHGRIGFIKTEETSPGVHEEVVTEKVYKGDLLRDTQNFNSGDKVNQDVTLGNRISIVADIYAHTNYPYARYVKWNGAYWGVSSIEIKFPRLILSIKGVYNGNTA